MKTTMHGLVKTAPGPGNVEYRDDLPIPVPGDDDVLVKIHVAALCGTDVHIVEWDKWSQNWVKPPVTIGHEACGEIVEVGKNVKDLKVGDRVSFETHIYCGECLMCKSGKTNICSNVELFGCTVNGAFAEYACAPAKVAYKIDDSLSDEVACLFEPMGAGIHGVERAEVEGKNVLVTGCGPIGLTAVAGAKTFGAKMVIACDLLDERLENAKAMGADYVVNSSKEDIILFCRDKTGGLGVDVAIDITGAGPALNNDVLAVRPGGRVVGVGLPTKRIDLDLANDVFYREVEITGISGRLIWQTWDDFAKVMQGPYFDSKLVLGETFDLKDFDKAVEAQKSGAPGKKLLRP